MKVKMWLAVLAGVGFSVAVAGCFPVETKFLDDAEFCDSLGLVLSLDGDKCVTIADADDDGDVDVVVPPGGEIVAPGGGEIGGVKFPGDGTIVLPPDGEIIHEDDDDNGNDNGNGSDRVVLSYFNVIESHVGPGDRVTINAVVTGGTLPHTMSCLPPDGPKENLDEDFEFVGPHTEAELEDLVPQIGTFTIIEAVGETVFWIYTTFFEDVEEDKFVTNTLPVYCMAMDDDGVKSSMLVDFIEVRGTAGTTSKRALFVYTPTRAREILSAHLDEVHRNRVPHH